MNPEEAVVDGDAEENTEENVESDTEASDVAEEKPPPRKPLVKLGDIMGVMYLDFCLAFENAGEICSSDINHSFGGPIKILFYCSNPVMRAADISLGMWRIYPLFNCSLLGKVSDVKGLRAFLIIIA